MLFSFFRRDLSAATAPRVQGIDVALFGFVLAFATLVRAEVGDDPALNQAYQEAVASKKINPESLKWTELQWITYRDAEAELQAKLGGSSKPDDAARVASLKATTAMRTAELQHLAKDGTSADLAEGRLEEAGVTNAYATLRKVAIASHDPDLIAAVIADQKAWLAFSGLEIDYDGYVPGHGSDPEKRRMSAVRLDRLRLAQLEADLSRLGVHEDTPDAAREATSRPNDRMTEVSPDHLLRIEQTDDATWTTSGFPVPATAWIISNQTGERETLPLKDDETGIGRGDPTVALSEYAISPDGQWIFRTQKFFHGMDGAYLYKRATGLHYAKATERPLDILAWEFFQATTHVAVTDTTHGGVIRFVAWEPHALRISLNAAERLTFANVNNWLADYDLTTGKFSVPVDAAAHDAKAFDASGR